MIPSTSGKAEASAIQGDVIESQSRRLKRCPRCEYSLFGLPINYHCPECGFEYDEHSREWGRSKDRVMGKILMTLGDSGWPVFYSTMLCIALDVWMPGLSRWFYLIIWSAGFGSIIYWVLRNHRLWFVTVSPEGVTYRIAMWNSQTIAWPDIVEARLGTDDNPGATGIRCYKAHDLYFGQVLNTKTEAREFVSAIEQGKRRYGHETEAKPMSTSSR